ncbi:MAG: PEP-CTERM sorting domain-containing protein [Rhodospirillaceae bacterium]|nr:PEP-CTERM sorting domain-containing protein [Rhodospirillaceae bacterium]
MQLKLSLLASGFLAAMLAAGAAQAHPVTGTIYFTTYTAVISPCGGPFGRVWSSTVSYDGVSTFTAGCPTAVNSTASPGGIIAGADGIAQNPQNSDLLIIGGQGPGLFNVSKSTGAWTSLSTPGGSDFHLEVDTPTHGFAMGIPFGTIIQYGIAPGGGLSLLPNITGTPGSSPVTQIIDTPFGYYYTSSGPGGFGEFGKISFAGTTYTTTPVLSGLAAAHGGTYDPLTGDIILYGDGHVTQIDLGGSYAAAPTIKSDLDFLTTGLALSGFNFDQGTVDGAGHIFAASNNGQLVFIDYSATGLVASASNFRAAPFLIDTLDDVAPLVGSGSTNTDIPAPAALLLLGLGLLGLGAFRRRC